MHRLLSRGVGGRSAAGWEVADLLAYGATYKEAARSLGASEQAVSKRTRTAMLEQERRACPVAARLLEEASHA